jgi:hypothetical protein
MWRVAFFFRMLRSLPFAVTLLRAAKPGEVLLARIDPYDFDAEGLEALSDGLAALGRPYIIVPKSVDIESLFSDDPTVRDFTIGRKLGDEL